MLFGGSGLLFVLLLFVLLVVVLVVVVISSTSNYFAGPLTRSLLSPPGVCSRGRGRDAGDPTNVGSSKAACPPASHEEEALAVTGAPELEAQMVEGCATKASLTLGAPGNNSAAHQSNTSYEVRVSSYEVLL